MQKHEARPENLDSNNDDVSASRSDQQKPTVDFKVRDPLIESLDKKNTVQRESSDDDDVVAPITFAPDGGWGWVVVAASFWHIFNLEGIAFSFGTMKSYIIEDLNSDMTSVALINSITVGFMWFFGPIGSALINKFGFRMVGMCGSTISALAAFVSSFATNYYMLLIFYGIFMGIGFSLIASSSNLIVGFYFEKRRALAIALSTCGSSLGISINAYTSHYLNRIGWRPTMLYQSAMLGTIFFTTMVYRPLLSITVQVVEPTMKKRLSTPYTDIDDATKQRRKSVNPEYKLAADFIDEQYEERELTLDETKRIRTKSKLVSELELPKLTEKYSKIQAVIDLSEETDKLVFKVHNKKDKKRKGWWAKLFHWKPHVKEARPLYRDDAFYTGNIKKIQDTRKSISLVQTDESKTGLDYDLAVSRVTTAKDIREKGVFTTAVKRVLKSMADPRLLKLKSFSIFLIAVFFSFLGIVIPYLYIIDRSKALNLPEKHYELFVSVIAFSGLFARISVGLIARKVPAILCYQIAAFSAGISSIVSNYFTVYWLQYLYCILFGFSLSGISISRYLVLIDLYGLELLTNGSGLVMFTMGLALMISPPTAGLILTHFGVYYSFVYSGTCCLVSGLCLCIVPSVRKREKPTTRRSIVALA